MRQVSVELPQKAMFSGTLTATRSLLHHRHCRTHTRAMRSRNACNAVRPLLLSITSWCRAPRIVRCCTSSPVAVACATSLLPSSPGTTSSFSALSMSNLGVTFCLLMVSRAASLSHQFRKNGPRYRYGNHFCGYKDMSMSRILVNGVSNTKASMDGGSIVSIESAAALVATPAPML